MAAMLRVLAICCWILLCLGNHIPKVLASQDVECELLKAEQGELKVLGKKTDVLPNEDKCWHIQLSNSSDEVVIVFHNFNLLESDRLTVRSAADEQSASNLFGPFRGQRGVFSVFTGLSSVVVHLKTSSDKPWNRHFMAKYSTNECKCSESVNNRGTMSSPLYLKERVVPLECSYTFSFEGSTSKLQKLVLSFLETNLTRGSDVQISGSENTNGKYQGDNMPNKLLSPRILNLKLLINPVPSHFQQFVAHYELATASCSSVIVLNGSASETFGVPPSLIPSDKDGVPASAQCHWILRSPNDTRIDANLLTNSAQIGARDSLTFGGPSSHESLHLGAGGKDLLIGGKSTSNELWVTFTSPSIQPNLALRMQATIHATGGYMRNSGNFSVSPQGNSVGTFRMEVPLDQRVRLLLPKLRNTTLELHSDFDGSSLPFLRLLPTTPLESVVSPGNRMMLVVRRHFQASFDGVDGACHGVAPLGGSGLYTAPRSCGNYTWLLPPGSDPGELAELRFLTLDLHPGDLVTLHALDDTLMVMATLRPGVMDPPPIRIPSETGLLMKLATRDGSGEDAVMQFSCVFKKSCRGTYELKSGQSVDLKSPSFPDRYPLGSTCQWELRWGGLILFDARSVQLAHPDHRLTVGDVLLQGSTRSQLAVIKGTTKVLFSAKSDVFGEESTSSGFSITATALDCGGIVRDRKGKLIVPPGSVTCVWVVNATADSGSSVVTSVFLKTTSNTKHLSVYENVSDAPKMDLTAGRELQTGRGLAVVVYNRSASSIGELLIEITYRTEDCPISSICGVNKCMSATWRCNGINDCGDYKDEVNCLVTNRPTWSPTLSPSPSSVVVVTGSEGKSTSSPTMLNNSTQSVEGQLVRTSDSGVSMMHLSLYVVAAVIVGATIPSSVYWCLLKRANGKRKTDSQWAMIGHGRKNSENADGISL